MEFSLNDLNDAQKKALLQIDGPVLVTAGAGSGKTRLLTYRIAYMIKELGIEPGRILAITFTNKAANEMKERISRLVGADGQRVWVSTFHSMCVKILRTDISLLGDFTSGFSIYDDSDQEKIIKKFMDEKNIDDKDFKKNLLFHISNIKNSGRGISEYKRDFNFIKNINEIIDYYERYQNELKKNNALDFDDLLLKTHELFLKEERVLEYYQEKFKYILVDEFQDTNRIQYNLVKLLSGKHKNIFIVGDEDQSIYSWRGAEIENILRFEKDFENVQFFKLEQNYRSTKAILEKANKIISNNNSRYSKKLFTDNCEGEKIVFHKCYDEQEEATYVAQKILSLVSCGEKFSSFAVLCRINALTLPFEQAFLSYNIPHKIFGGFMFFDRAEIKILISYLRIFVNPNDEVSLFRIINTPKRGIGEQTLLKIKAAGEEHGFKSTLESIINFEKLDIGETLKQKLSDFSAIYNELKSKMDSTGLEDFVVSVIKGFNIKSSYSSKSEEDINRIMNIDAFIMATAEFEQKNPSTNFVGFLESITLASDLDNIDESNCVVIATVHSVKGLEFPNVFIVGLEEGIFPIGRAKDNANELEEERRLMYVAVTRAEKNLFLTNCKTRYLYGKRGYMIPSRFLAEMEIGENFNFVKSDYYNYNTENKTEKIVFQKPVFESIKKTEKKIVDYKVGSRVSHPRFGEGIVLSIAEDIVDVDFVGFGKKTLMIELAPLTLIEEI